MRMRHRAWLPAWTKHWARDSGLLLLSQFSAVVATSLLAILVARNLGPSDWGIFSGFLGLSLAFSIVVNFGVGGWLLRELSKLWAVDDCPSDEASGRAGHLVSGAIVLNVGLGMALVLGTLIVTQLVHLDSTATLALVSLMGYAALSGAVAGLEAFFRSRRQLRVVVGAVLVEKFLLLFLVGLAVVAELGIAGIAAMYLVAGMARVLFYGANTRASKHVVISLPSFTSLRGAMRDSLPFALNAASLNVIPRLDTFVLVTLSATAAGYFALGDRILGPLIMIPWVMSSALYPFLAREEKRTHAGWRMVAVFAGAGALLAIVGIAFAPILVPLIFGNAYDEAVDVVRMMLLAIPFVYGSNVMLAQLYTWGRERSILVVTLGISAIGTLAIVAGQLAVGSTGAAAGYVLRQVLFLVGLGTIAAIPFWVQEDHRNRGAQPNGETGRPSRRTEEDSGSIPTV
jgi:O-antigen/teichoic acid export membrane protein